MSSESAAIAAITAIVMTVGVRVITASLVDRKKKELVDINAALRDTREALNFAAERSRVAVEVMSFSVRQRKDLVQRVEDAREDLLSLVEEENNAEGKPGESEEIVEVKLPRHMREQDE